jgi:CubicO group peptidase (beta-lactamase class C family)
MEAARIRTALEAGLAQSGLPGITAAALTPSGETVHLAVGRRGADDPAPLTEETPFWIASMTKAITSVVALQLVGEGRVILDDPVGERLPELAAPQVLAGFDADGKPICRPAATPVTLRSLLAHTSGLAYDFTSADLSRWLALTGGDMIGRNPPAGLPLLFDPGSGWSYGYSLDFVGRLIEAVTGAELGAVYAERIFRPLGMSSTTFALTADQRARLAPMHMRLPDGGLAPLAFALPDPPFFQMGGGGLYSTAPDYLRFLTALMGEAGKLLPPDLGRLLFTSQVTEPRPGALVSAAPHLANDFDAFPGQPTGWTLGFLANLEPGPAGRSAGSLCWAGLSNCYFWLDREAGVAGVMLAQLLPFADRGALALFDRFERAVYAT